MARALPDLGKSEWILMDCLWRVGRGTATEMQRELQVETGWAYSTVKTMLDRLSDKGYVKSRRVGNVYEYSPKVRRTSVVSRAVNEVLDRVLEGSLAPFLHQLIQRRQLSAGEVEELRNLLDDYRDPEESQPPESQPPESQPPGAHPDHDPERER